MNNYPITYDQKNQQLIVSVRQLQKSIHLCCELLPLIPNLKNVSNVLSLFQEFHKTK